MCVCDVCVVGVCAVWCLWCGEGSVAPLLLRLLSSSLGSALPAEVSVFSWDDHTRGLGGGLTFSLSYMIRHTGG